MKLAFMYSLSQKLGIGHLLEFGEIYSFADLFGTKCVHGGAPILEKNPL